MADKENTEQEVSEETVNEEEHAIPNQRVGIRLKCKDFNIKVFNEQFHAASRAIKRHIKHKGYDVQDKDIKVRIEKDQIKLIWTFFGGES